MTLEYCVEMIRAQFPALQMDLDGSPAVFFDGPGGTQVPERVLASIEDYLVAHNANRGGPFPTSARTDALIEESRLAVATFMGAEANEIAFGANMTTLNYSLARALGRMMEPNEEIIITDLDHEGNRGPWLSLQEMGITVMSVAIDPRDCTLDLEDLEAKVTSKTRIAAVTAASNAVGTIVDLAEIRRRLPEGCLLVVDAVHLAPHRMIDVREMDCDFLLCSAYKFFGPHLGIMYGKRDSFDILPTDRLRPQKDRAPERIETGTLNHEGIAGTMAAIDFIADPMNLGIARSRDHIIRGMRAIGHHEDKLFAHLYEGLSADPRITIHGPEVDRDRTPTAGFTLEGVDARTVVASLCKMGIFSWDGHFYAQTLVERLDPGPGGLVRVGLAPYNTVAEVNRFLDAVERIGSSYA